MLEEIRFLVLRNIEETFCRRKLQILFTINRNRYPPKWTAGSLWAQAPFPGNAVEDGLKGTANFRRLKRSYTSQIWTVGLMCLSEQLYAFFFFEYAVNLNVVEQYGMLIFFFEFCCQFLNFVQATFLINDVDVTTCCYGKTAFIQMRNSHNAIWKLKYRTSHNYSLTGINLSALKYFFRFSTNPVQPAS